MPGAVEGVNADIKRLAKLVREENGWQDNSKIILIGHSTGCLALTRAAQDLELSSKEDGGKFAGIISTGPLYGVGNIDGTESVANRLNPCVHASAMGILRLIGTLAPKKVVSYSYVSEKD